MIARGPLTPMDFVCDFLGASSSPVVVAGSVIVSA